MLPLTLTVLSAAVPASKRGLALGAWGGISGLAVALGPVVGGAIVQAMSWQWIFWLNVPVGIALVPLAWTRLAETRGPAVRLDLPGLSLSAVGLFAIVWGLVRGNSSGWSSPEIITALASGAAVIVVFVAWERCAVAPMLPMRLFRDGAFTFVNTASLFMYFGMFGSIFLLSQFFQTMQHDSPLGSGLRILAWTIAPMFISPVAGALSDRLTGRTLIGTGLARQPGWPGSASPPPQPRPTRRSSDRSCSLAQGWDCSSPRWPTSRSPPSGPPSKDRRPARTMPSANSAACSELPSSPPSSPATAATAPGTLRHRHEPALLLGAVVVAAGAAAAFAIPRGRPATPGEAAGNEETLEPITA